MGGGNGGLVRRAPTAPPSDDVPLPPEPPADEPPPEDDFDPYTRPPGPLSATRPVVDLTSHPSGAASTHDRGTRPSRYATLRAAAPAADRESVAPIAVSDDEPSVDDVTLEESGLVGPTVVAQLLGGRVIEEREE